MSGVQTTLFEVDILKYRELFYPEAIATLQGLEMSLNTQWDYYIAQEHKITHHERKPHICRNSLHKILGYSHPYYRSSCENSKHFTNVFHT